VTEGRAGFAGLFSGTYIFPTILLGLMSATALMLVYSLNTWLPELMLRAGFNAKGSLSFLLVLNGGSLLGALAASRAADRFGPKPVVACSSRSVRWLSHCSRSASRWRGCSPSSRSSAWAPAARRR